MKISDEAHAAASRAAEDTYRRWHATPNRDAYVSGFIAAAAKNAVEAAAPLIATQVLRQAAAILEQAAADTHPPSRRLTAFAAVVATGLRITANSPERSPAGRPKPPPDTSWVKTTDPGRSLTEDAP